jgi:hypothetical protein
MEKARKGLKPVKLPLELFVSWKDIISRFIQANQNVKLIPAVIVLEKLIACQDATYERQASCIKEAGKRYIIRIANGVSILTTYFTIVKGMQKNVSAMDKLEAYELQQIKSLVEPIASLGYFAACENLSRRTFVPLIEAAIRCTGQENIMFKNYYMEYTSNESTEYSFQGKPLSQKALTIYATLSFPLGRDSIVSSYQHTLQFLVDGLQSAQNQLKSNTHHANVDQLMNDIQFTVKTVLVLMSRQLEVAPRLFEKVESKEINHKEDKDVVLLAEIIKTLLDLCVDTTTFIKECNQVAGMAIGAIINLADDIEFARDWVLGWFFTTQSNKAVDHIEAALGIPCPCEKLVGVEGWNSRDAPMIFALRGLVSSLRKEIVILDCPANLSLVPAIEK